MPYKFVHFYRHPFKKIVSGFRYHREGAEAWTKRAHQYNNTCHYPSSRNIHSSSSSSSPSFSDSSSSFSDEIDNLTKGGTRSSAVSSSSSHVSSDRTHSSSHRGRHSVLNNFNRNSTDSASPVHHGRSSKEGPLSTAIFPDLSSRYSPGSSYSPTSSSRFVTRRRGRLTRDAVVDYCRCNSSN